MEKVIGSLNFNPEVSAGDVITSLSIVVSALALAYAWWRDRQLRRREQADKVRNAAAKTLAKLGRWQELSLRFYDDVSPLLVETSGMLVENFDVFRARDFLYRKVEETRQSATERILNEEIEIAYVELYGYLPAIYGIFVRTIEKLKEEDKGEFNWFRGDTEADVLSFRNQQPHEYQTAVLGNRLRGTRDKCKEHLRTSIDNELKEVRKLLLRIVLASDRNILNGNLLPQQAP